MQLTAPAGGENMIQAINNITLIQNRSQPLDDCYLKMWTIQKFPEPFGFISPIHVAKSPEREFGKNLLFIIYRRTSQIYLCTTVPLRHHLVA